MDILAHRGAWATRSERNTLDAFRRAWRSGHGVETDLRDHAGRVVISHDPPVGDAHLSLDDLLAAWQDDGEGSTLALNIKCDGLAEIVVDALERHGAEDSAFVFDMSVPDHVAWLAGPVPTFSRWSEWEAPVLRAEAAGLWLDAFRDDGWWDPALVTAALDDGLRVALVSPELHGREPEPSWHRVRDAGWHDHGAFALCTDVTARAEEFFA